MQQQSSCTIPFTYTSRITCVPFEVFPDIFHYKQYYSTTCQILRPTCNGFAVLCVFGIVSFKTGLLPFRYTKDSGRFQDVARHADGGSLSDSFQIGEDSRIHLMDSVADRKKVAREAAPTGQEATRKKRKYSERPSATTKTATAKVLKLRNVASYEAGWTRVCLCFQPIKI